MSFKFRKWALINNYKLKICKNDKVNWKLKFSRNKFYFNDVLLSVLFIIKKEIDLIAKYEIHGENNEWCVLTVFFVLCVKLSKNKHKKYNLSLSWCCPLFFGRMYETKNTLFWALIEDEKTIMNSTISPSWWHLHYIIYISTYLALNDISAKYENFSKFSNWM